MVHVLDHRVSFERQLLTWTLLPLANASYLPPMAWKLAMSRPTFTQRDCRFGLDVFDLI